MNIFNRSITSNTRVPGICINTILELRDNHVRIDRRNNRRIGTCCRAKNCRIRNFRLSRFNSWIRIFVVIPSIETIKTSKIVTAPTIERRFKLLQKTRRPRKNGIRTIPVDKLSGKQDRTADRMVQVSL